MTPLSPHWHATRNASWMQESRLILAGFIAAAAIMAFVGWESYRDTTRVAVAAAARKHSFEVRGLLGDTTARLVNAETGQRGFLLTGDDAYLEPYRNAINNLDRVISELKNSTADNPNQQRRIQLLRGLVEKKIAELQKTIDLRKKKGLAAANEIVLSGEGKQWMDQIRGVLAEMQEEEDHIRTLRSREMTDALQRTSRIVVAGNLLSALLLFVVFVLLFRALSERKRAQEAAERSEKLWSTTLSSIGDAVIATDMNGSVTFLNTVAQSLTGWNLEDAQGKSMDLVFDIVNKETRRPVENPVKKVFRKGKIVGLADHTILRSRNGKEFDIEDSAAPILTDSGEAFGVVLVFRDITDKKLAEEETRRQKDLLQLILASVADGVVVADTNGKFLVFNAAAERFVGIGAIDVSPDQWSQQYGSFLPDGVTLCPPNELPLVRAMRGENVDDVELFIRNPNVPEGRLLNIAGRPLKGEDGSLKGGVVVLHDITERKRAEEALRQSEERFRLLVSEVTDYAILMLDPEGRIASWNAGAERIKRYKRDEIIGQHFSRFYPAEDVEQGKPAHELKVAREQGRFEDEGWRVRKDRSRFWANAVITALRDATGRLRGFGKVTRDITERKRAEEMMLHAKEQAERTSRFKDQFLSTMNHELRTPLNAVLGFSDLLADERYGPLNEKQRRYIDHIHTGGKHLLTLISDILDLSKIEAGKMELTREDVTVASAFADVISSLYPLAEKKSQALLQQVDGNLHVHADAMRFKQVLMNLAGNAIKFTPTGGRIELAARQLEDQVRVEVRDDGPGIPPEQQQRIFEAFFRLTQAGTATEGTGLGLAITARLVELHGGKLGIESQPGGGTCFYFSLPLVAIAPGQPDQTSGVVPRARNAPRILVVEDNAATGQLIQSQLASSGYETLKCDQPERASDIAAELQPDAITLDLLMSPVHGLELLLQLKNDPRTARIPVIVVTIVDQPSIGTAFGADEYLIKPVDKATLLAAVERCLRSRGGAAPTRTILVVEDDVSTLEMIVELLKAYGYAVSTAADGEQARISVAQFLPELVILDIVLPKMSGFELLAEWRSNPRTPELSLFVLTS